MIYLSLRRDGILASVDQTVELLKTKWLKVDDLDRLLNMYKDAAVSELHLSFGTAVRNSWNLPGRDPAGTRMK